MPSKTLCFLQPPVQDHINTMYIRYFRLGNHQMYGVFIRVLRLWPTLHIPLCTPVVVTACPATLLPFLLYLCSICTFWEYTVDPKALAWIAVLGLQTASPFLHTPRDSSTLNYAGRHIEVQHTWKYANTFSFRTNLKYVWSWVSTLVGGAVLQLTTQTTPNNLLWVEHVTQPDGGSAFPVLCCIEQLRQYS